MLTISFDNVSLRFGAREVFHNFSATFAAGKIFAVTGANGSGKSTLLKLAAKFILPDEGTVKVCRNKAPLSGADYRRTIAAVMPEMRFYERLTAAENLRFLAGLRGAVCQEAESDALLRRVGLEPEAIRSVYAGQLSTGMRGRLKIAALLSANAAVWLLDEPGANFDAAGNQLLQAETRAAADAGKLILWATNDAREEALADEIVALAP